MLLLKFQAGSECFGLDVSSIVSVVPVPQCRRIPLSPSYFLGLCQYRGTVIPVVDLSSLLANTPSQVLFSTRMIVVRTDVGLASTQTLGLVAERAVQTVRYSQHELIDPPVRVRQAPYLGKVLISSGSIIQLLSLPQLLEPEAAEMVLEAGRNAD